MKLVLPPEAREHGLPIPMALRGLHIDDVPIAYVLAEVPDIGERRMFGGLRSSWADESAIRLRDD